MAIPKFVVCLLLMETFRLSDAEIKLQVCEHQNLAIECDEGEIKILSALYGRNNTEDCPHRTIPNFVNRYGSMCASEVSLEVLKTRCESKTSCSVPAENSVFGDPCVNVFKYLEVEYFCDSGQAETPPSLASEAPLECPRSVVKVEGITLTFPAAVVGEQSNSVELCLDGSFDSDSSVGTRICGDDSRWENAELTNCYKASSLEDSLTQLALMNITEDTVNEVAVNLAVASSAVDTIKPAGLESIITALASVVEVGTTSTQVTESVVVVVDNFMALDEEAIADTSNVSGVVLSLEKQVALFHQNEQNYTEYGSYLEVSAWQLEKESLVEGFTVNSQYPGNIVNNTDEADNLTGSSIRLPPFVIDIISRVHPNISLVPLTFITYVDARLFQPIEEFHTSQSTNTSVISSYVDSQVITANVELDDVSIKDLPQNSSVLINFPVPNMVPEVTKCNTTRELACVFWEYNKTIGGGKWSQEGCTMLSSTDEEIVCSCNHLTSFAVLVREHDPSVSKTFRVVLRVLTVVGCILSIVGLSISVIAILSIRKLRGAQTFRVHANLCFALIAFYVTFVIGIDRTSNPVGCKIIASFIYFFCLSSMAWMSVEAVQFYHLVFKLNQGDVKNLLPVSITFAWGVPMSVAMVVAFMDQSHDYECFPDYCFLHPGLGMYIGFLLLIGLMFVFNTILFSMIICKFCCRKIITKDEEKKRKEIAGRVKGIVLFWFLLGMSWIFGLVAAIPPIGPVKIIFDILFSVFMTLQGFVMSYFLAFNNPEVKKLLNRLTCCGENILIFSSSISTSKTTQGFTKSGSNN